MQENTTKTTNQKKKKTVVITGASSGIGRATALEFARLQQANLVLIARSENALRDLATQCEQVGSRTYIVTADVTDETAMQNAGQKAMETFGSLDVWVNNAGVTMFSRFEETPSASFRRVIDTNLFGYVNGARAAMPRFREQGKGTLINISSVAGAIAQPFSSAYSASKFAINGFSESLRMELMDSPDIHVSTVLAPSVDTPLFQHGANYTGRAVKPMDPVYTADKVARAIVAVSDNPVRETVVGNVGRSMLMMDKVAPGMAERMMARKVSEGHFQDKPAQASEGNLFKPMEQCSGVSGGWKEQEEPVITRQQRVAFGLGILGAGLGALGWMYAKGMLKFGHKKNRLTRFLGK